MPFIVAGVACSAVLFLGAYGLLRSSMTEDEAKVDEAIVAEPAPGAPDFVSLMPSLEGEQGRSVVRLPDDRTESYVVGYRSAEGPALGLVVKSLVGYRIAATLNLNVGQPAQHGAPAVHLWTGRDGAPRVVAVMSQLHGGSAAYVVTVSDGSLSLVERMSPMSDVPPQYVALGESGGVRRTARLGDLDGDGQPNELMIEIQQGSQRARFEAYELKGGSFAWRSDLITALSRSATLFDDHRADVSEMLVIDAASPDGQPTVVEFPVAE
jgi:hypothetical protein